MDTKALYAERPFMIRVESSPLISWYATWPFSKFELHESHLIVKILFIKLRLDFTEIDSVQKYHHPLLTINTTGLKINHHVKTARFLVVWPKHLDQVLSILQQKGISIDMQVQQ